MAGDLKGARKRWSAEDRQAQVARWRESGLSTAAYCRQSGLPYSALVLWAAPRPVQAVDEGADAQTGFVQLTPPAVRVGGGCGVIARLPGLALELPLNTEPERIAAVLKAVRSC